MKNGHTAPPTLESARPICNSQSLEAICFILFTQNLNFILPKKMKPPFMFCRYMSNDRRKKWPENAQEIDMCHT